MNGGFERQFTSLTRRRFQERDRHFRARLLAVKQEHNERGLLMSSTTVVAMHAALENELRGSASECVKTVAEVMATAFLAPRKQLIERACADELLRRRQRLEGIFHGAAANILGSLSNSCLTEPYRAISDGFFELQAESACTELRAKRRELFWLKLDRVLKLLKLRTALMAVVLAGLSYLGRHEIADLWDTIREQFAGTTLDTGESIEKGAGTDTAE